MPIDNPIRENSDWGHYWYPEPPLVIKPGTFTGTPQELAQAILRQVTEYPENFSMWTWIDLAGVWPKSEEAARAIEEQAKLEGTPCGTTMCIAGYAQLFTKGYVMDDTVTADAARALGIANPDLPGDDDSFLFYVSDERALAGLEYLAQGGTELVEWDRAYTNARYSVQVSDNPA